MGFLAVHLILLSVPCRETVRIGVPASGCCGWRASSATRGVKCRGETENAGAGMEGVYGDPVHVDKVR